MRSRIITRPAPPSILRKIPGQDGGVPPGVTFEDIMGGPTYYADNGFTYAVTHGFDDPDFFPICAFLLPMLSQSDADDYIAHGMNGLIGVSDPDNSDLFRFRDNNLWLFAQAGELDRILVTNGSLGSESVGINAWDEPETYAEAIGAIGTVANTHQDGRLFYENYTWNQLNYGNVESHDMPDLLNDLVATPNATTRHLDVIGVDIYWFSGYGGADGGAFNSGSLYNTGTGILTNDQRRRGARYGDMIDWMHLGMAVHSYPAWQPTYPAPMGVWIETGSPYTENDDVAQRVTPAEVNAAVWNTLIHGARLVKYFHSHDFGSAGTDSGMEAQMLATGNLIQSLAGVLNSPFALGYGSATSPSGGWKWGDGPPSAFSGSGVDTMVKYYNVSGGDGLFYLFAHPRYSAATTSQSVTFTIADTSATVATVINESRTVSISGGTFTDTFATGNTVHIYRIES